MEILDEDYFLGTYIDWRRKRLNFILHYYGFDFFKGKTLLEVGCGFGHLGSVFYELGANVTCCDAKELYLQEMRRRFPHINALQCNLDEDFPEGKYDICIHMGVLYHLKDPEKSIRFVLNSAQHVILETEVCDSDDPYFFVPLEENSEKPGAAFGAIGVRLSAAYIERVLIDAGVEFTRYDDPRLNSGGHLYDWEVKNTGQVSAGGMRRFWFIESKKRSE